MPTDYDGAFQQALQKLGFVSTPGATVYDHPVNATVVEETIAHDPEHDTVHVEDPGGVTAANIWRHPDAHPVVLDLLLIRRFGPEWLLLEPETLQVRIPEEFKTQSLSDLNLSKLQACKTLHVSQSFWERWEVFVWSTMTLNGEFPDFEMMQVPTVPQTLVAADIAMRIRDDVPWSPEVTVYLETLWRHEGVLLPLPPLDFLKIKTDDLDVNMESIRSRWPTVRGEDNLILKGTVEDEQLRRLLEANDYLEMSRRHLRTQLSMVTHA